MISPKGAPSRTARSRWSSNVAVIEQPGQAVGLRADLDGPEDLGVLERDRDLGREQLDEVELLGREGVAAPRRSIVRTPIAPDRPRNGTTMRLPSRFRSGPRKWLTRGSWRSSSM